MNRMSLSTAKPVMATLATTFTSFLAALSLTACTAQAEVKPAATTAKAGTATAANDKSSDVKEYHLDNGMKILVKPDHRAPVVVSQVWYKTGSSYEINGVTGVAHVLEHMMFKGTKELGPNEFSRIIAANGGSENAFTSQDYTTYFQQLEKTRLPISMKLEADRMQNLNLRAEDFAKEIQVVMEERRMRTDDKPNSQTYEQFIATAFVNSPYHHPTLGWMTDLKHMTVDDTRNWYNHWYAPNNATLVVVGDVDPDAVYAMAKKYYGPVKPKDVPTSRPQTEIPQHGMRTIHVKATAQLPYLLMGYKVPVVKTASEAWEPYALEMLAYVLDGGNSARFSKELVRGSQVAASANAGYDLYSRLGDLFTIDATPAQGHNIKDLEQAIRAQIKRLKDEPVSKDELDRFKTQIVASKVYEKDSVFYQAMQIGTLETVGLDWHLMDQYVDKIRAVTPAQIQQVARKYLVDDGLTVGILDPQKIPMQASIASSSNTRNGGNHAH
jgi:zinc protease